VKGPLKLVAPFVAALAVAACSAAAHLTMPVSGGGIGADAMHIPQWQATHSARAACGGSRIGQAQCDVLIENGGAHSLYAVVRCVARRAYDLPITKGKGQNVYIVDAFDNPDVVSDLQRTVRARPATGKLNKYNQDGQTTTTVRQPGLGVEIDLDVEMASASCPLCTINLIEANPTRERSRSGRTRGREARGTIVSNSYDGSGGSESDMTPLA